MYRVDVFYDTVQPYTLINIKNRSDIHLVGDDIIILSNGRKKLFFGSLDTLKGEQSTSVCSTGILQTVSLITESVSEDTRDINFCSVTSEQARIVSDCVNCGDIVSNNNDGNDKNHVLV